MNNNILMQNKQRKQAECKQSLMKHQQDSKDSKKNTTLTNDTGVVRMDGTIPVPAIKRKHPN